MWMKRLIISAASVGMLFSPTVWSQEKEPIQPRHGGRQMTVDKTSSDQSVAVMDRVLIDLVAWRTQAAEQILASAAAKYAGTAAYETADGVLRFNQGKQTESSTLLQTATRTDVNDPAPSYYRGEVLQAQSKHDAARDSWQQARNRARSRVDSNPQDARSLYYLGAALVRLKDPGAARTALKAAATRGFDPRMTSYQIALTHMLDKDWQQAKESLDAVLAADSRFAPAYFYRGVVWSKLGRNDKMAEDLEEFLLLAPRSPDAETAQVLLSGYHG